MKAGILCAQGLEECEALITYDLLYRAGIKVELVGLQDVITSSHNVTFNTHVNIDDFNYAECDCLILPGGMPGTLNLENDERVQKLIDYFVENDKYIAAICAAPSILAHKGLLKDGGFVCFPGHESGLKTAEGRACTDGKIITGRGMGAGLHFSYEIIKALIDEDKAKEVFAKIQY